MASDQSLTQRAGRSALWQIAGGGWQTFVRLGASVFLARALVPSDFGLVGMAMIVYKFLTNIGALGMGAGIIAKKDVSDDDLCTCFWSIAVMRVIMFIVVFLGAPLASYFFNDPRLTEVLRVISCTFLISILSAVSQIMLSRELKFKALNVIRGISALLESCIAIYFALTTSLGYWALIIGMLVHALTIHPLIFIVAGWKPNLKFNKESFSYLCYYGINNLGFNLTNYLRQNLDYILVGRILGTQALGFYEFAYRIPHLVNIRISNPVGAVVFPTLSKLQDDYDQLAQAYSQAIKYVGLITFPMLLGLVAVADVAVLVLWGEQWIPIIMPLRILCFSALMLIIVRPLGAIFNTIGRPDLHFKISLLSLVWTMLVLGIIGNLYGLNGFAIGMVLSALPNMIALYVAFRKINRSIFVLYLHIKPIFISAISCSASAYACSQLLQFYRINDVIIFMISIIIGAIIYLSVMLLLYPNECNEILKLCETVTEKKLKYSFIKKMFEKA